jgi:hypothetical protein
MFVGKEKKEGEEREGKEGEGEGLHPFELRREINNA